MNVCSATDAPANPPFVADLCDSLLSSAANTDERSHHAVAVCGHEEGGEAGLADHERFTHNAIAHKLAVLKRCPFVGGFEAAERAARRTYLVPCRTLTLHEATHQFGIGNETDLFGGVVPYPFVSTKVITHGLIHEHALAPSGWSGDFSKRIKKVVLPGFSVFTAADGLAAGLRLLKAGTVRLKAADGIGGSGQWMVRDRASLETHLHKLDAEGRLANGLVVERNLSPVATRSVGQVSVGGLTVTYHGTQRETLNNSGHRVYGGSDLIVVRGGWQALLELAALSPAVHTAIQQARLYDAAATHCFTGAFMSRRNYDVAQGLDDQGRWRSGVLEQSWRIGGASGAEVAALELFAADPALHTVRSSTTELYGSAVPVPRGAFVYFQGTDSRVGPITKYSQVQPDADA